MFARKLFGFGDENVQRNNCLLSTWRKPNSAWNHRESLQTVRGEAGMDDLSTEGCIVFTYNWRVNCAKSTDRGDIRREIGGGLFLRPLVGICCSVSDHCFKTKKYIFQNWSVRVFSRISMLRFLNNIRSMTQSVSNSICNFLCFFLSFFCVWSTKPYVYPLLNPPSHLFNRYIIGRCPPGFWGQVMYEPSCVNPANILLSSERTVFFVQYKILTFNVWGHVVILR